VRKAKLLSHIATLQQTLEQQAAAQHAVLLELSRRLEAQDKRMNALQFQLLQRLALLEQAHQAELSLQLEARQRQQEKLRQLEHALEAHRDELELLDSSLSRGQAA
jgi:hypothetical protein